MCLAALQNHIKLVAGLIVAAVGWFLLQLFGPNPPIVVSPDTTYIVEPLAGDGLPDYFEALRQELSAEVTPDNNAAAHILKINGWPNEDQGLLVSIRTELGVEPFRDTAAGFAKSEDEQFLDEVVNWLKSVDWTPPASEMPTDDETPEYREAVYRNACRAWLETAVSVAAREPWTTQDCPPLSAWVDRNERAFAIAGEASQRPRFYGAMVADPDYSGPRVLGREMLLQKRAKDLSHGLAIRAMRHAGEGRAWDSLADLMACRRLAELLRQTPQIIDQLIATAIEGMSLAGMESLTLLSGADRRIYAEIRRQTVPADKSPSMLRAIAHGERLLALDATMDLVRSPKRYAQDDAIWARLDWTLIFRGINRCFDAAVMPYEVQDKHVHDELIEQYHALDDHYDRISDSRIQFVKGFVSTRARSEAILAKLARTMMPAAASAMHTTKSLAAKTQLTHVAAALAEWQERNGAYPDRLDALIPSLLDQKLIDPFGERLQYANRGEGYLLYCLETSREPRIEIVGFESVPLPEESRIRDHDHNPGAYSVSAPTERLDWPGN